MKQPQHSEERGECREGKSATPWPQTCPHGDTRRNFDVSERKLSANGGPDPRSVFLFICRSPSTGSRGRYRRSQRLTIYWQATVTCKALQDAGTNEKWEGRNSYRTCAPNGFGRLCHLLMPGPSGLQKSKSGIRRAVSLEFKPRIARQ